MVFTIFNKNLIGDSWVLEFSLFQFLQHNVHLGASPLFSLLNSFWFISGVREKFTVINIGYSVFYYREFFNVTAVSSISRMHVMFVNERVYSKRFLISLARSIGEPYVAGRWIGGVLTNFKWLWAFYLRSLKNVNKVFLPVWKVKIKNALSGFDLICSLPKVVFFNSSRYSIWGTVEANSLKLASAGLVDVDASAVNNLYSVPANDDSFVSVYFLNLLLAKMVLIGKMIRVSNFGKKFFQFLSLSSKFLKASTGGFFDKARLIFRVKKYASSFKKLNETLGFSLGVNIWRASRVLEFYGPMYQRGYIFLKFKKISFLKLFYRIFWVILKKLIFRRHQLYSKFFKRIFSSNSTFYKRKKSIVNPKMFKNWVWFFNFFNLLKLNSKLKLKNFIVPASIFFFILSINNHKIDINWLIGGFTQTFNFAKLFNVFSETNSIFLVYIVLKNNFLNKRKSYFSFFCYLIKFFFENILDLVGIVNRSRYFFGLEHQLINDYNLNILNFNEFRSIDYWNFFYRFDFNLSSCMTFLFVSRWFFWNFYFFSFIKNSFWKIIRRFFSKFRKFTWFFYKKLLLKRNLLNKFNVFRPIFFFRSNLIFSKVRNSNFTKGLFAPRPWHWFKNKKEGKKFFKFLKFFEINRSLKSYSKYSFLYFRKFWRFDNFFFDNFKRRRFHKRKYKRFVKKSFYRYRFFRFKRLRFSEKLLFLNPHKNFRYFHGFYMVRWWFWIRLLNIMYKNNNLFDSLFYKYFTFYGLYFSKKKKFEQLRDKWLRFFWRKKNLKRTKYRKKKKRINVLKKWWFPLIFIKKKLYKQYRLKIRLKKFNDAQTRNFKILAVDLSRTFKNDSNLFHSSNPFFWFRYAPWTKKLHRMEEYLRRRIKPLKFIDRLRAIRETQLKRRLGFKYRGKNFKYLSTGFEKYAREKFSYLRVTRFKRERARKYFSEKKQSGHGKRF